MNSVDYESYMGFGREAQDGLYIEFGPYYRQHEFAPSSLTNPGFQVPGDFTAYGARAYLEQRAIQMDRRSGMPQQGFVLTLTGEREWNDSEGTFGLVAAGGEGAQLPASLWRARGRLEWYVPQSDALTWEIFAYGGMQDPRDRIFNSEGQRPLGYEWADAQLRLRWLIGRSISVNYAAAEAGCPLQRIELPLPLEPQNPSIPLIKLLSPLSQLV